MMVRCDSEGERQQRRSSRWCSLALGRHQKRRGAGVQARITTFTAVRASAARAEAAVGSSWGESRWETSHTEGV